MLQLRVFGTSTKLDGVRGRLENAAFVRHTVYVPATGVHSGLPLADIEPDSAGEVLDSLHRAGIGRDALETRASAAVGVAISVTTIPAAAYLGVALSVDQYGNAFGALAVLGVNVAMLLVGGTATLIVQRLLNDRSDPPRWREVRET